MKDGEILMSDKKHLLIPAGARKMRMTSVLAIGIAVLAYSGVASAAQTITDATGQYTVGIGTDGQLYDAGSEIGFQRKSDGFDPLQPGSPYNSWGVTTSAGSAWVNGVGSAGNIGSTSTFLLPNAGTSITSTTTAGVTVNQAFNFATPNVLTVTEFITNTSGTTLNGVNFQRVVDWDVAPTPFNENSISNPISGNVSGKTYYGFDSPLAGLPFAYSTSAPGGNNQVGDLGGGIDVKLGSLAAGQTATVTFAYGISQTGQNVNGLIGELAGLGFNNYVATQSMDGGQYPGLGTNSAIIAVHVSGVPGPIPGVGLLSFALLALGGALTRMRGFLSM